MQNSNSFTQETQGQIQQILQGGKLDVRNFLLSGMSELLNKALESERQFYLDNNQSENEINNDKANGFSASRNVNFGTNSIPISVPRVRSGNFYPSLLPKYGRNLGNEYNNILEGIILNSKSFKSVANTMHSLNLPYSKSQIDSIVSDLFEESKRFNNRQLSSDWGFVYADAKVIDVIDDTSEHIKKAVSFTIIGVDMKMKKELLLSAGYFGNESLDLWRKVIINLKNRGLTRVMMLITDDFSGLNKLVASLLPKCDHQLCLVHMLRNAKSNFDRKTYEEFKGVLNEIYLSGSHEAAHDKLSKWFSSDNLVNNYSSNANYLKERIDNYLVFMKYPRAIHASIRSTNPVEGINNAIEIARRNSGGYFHSERELAVKLKIVFDNMAKTKWIHPMPKFKGCIAEITQMFFARFEE